jgi:hypothetical protein
LQILAVLLQSNVDLSIPSPLVSQIPTQRALMIKKELPPDPYHGHDDNSKAVFFLLSLLPHDEVHVLISHFLELYRHCAPTKGSSFCYTLALKVSIFPSCFYDVSLHDGLRTTAAEIARHSSFFGQPPLIP